LLITRSILASTEATSVVVDMGGFKLTVKDKKVYHKNEDITNFVCRLCDMFFEERNFPGSEWTVTPNGNLVIEDIIFRKTGCEKSLTKLSDWLKVYDLIK